MKFWTDVLKYSTGLATLLVLTVCGLVVLSVIGAAVAISKLWAIME